VQAHILSAFINIEIKEPRAFSALLAEQNLNESRSE